MAIFLVAVASYKNTHFPHINRMIERKKIKKVGKIKAIAVAIAASFVGLINGLLGAGGGSLVVPLYQSGLDLEAKTAHATAIATMLPSCLVSGIIYLTRGGFDYVRGSIISAGVILGGIAGAVILKYVKNNLLSLSFYLIMIYAGVRLLAH